MSLVHWNFQHLSKLISLLSLQFSLPTLSSSIRTFPYHYAARSAHLSISFCLVGDRSPLGLPLHPTLKLLSPLPKKMDSSSLIPCGAVCGSHTGADAGTLADVRRKEWTMLSLYSQVQGMSVFVFIGCWARNIRPLSAMRRKFLLRFESVECQKYACDRQRVESRNCYEILRFKMLSLASPCTRTFRLFRMRKSGDIDCRNTVYMKQSRQTCVLVHSAVCGCGST